MKIALVAIELGLCLYSSQSARLKSHSNQTIHHIDTGQLLKSGQDFQHGFGLIRGTLRSVLGVRSQNEDALAQEEGNSMWIMVLVLGIIIGWFCFSFCSGFGRDDDAEDGSRAKGSFARFTRAVRSSVKIPIPQAAIQQEEDMEADRIILVETLYRVPSGNKKITHEAIHSLDLPDIIGAWEPVSCALIEAEDGLYICIADERSESKTRLVQWSGNPQKYVEADKLPQVMLARSPEQSVKSTYRGSISTFGEHASDEDERDPESSMHVGEVNFNRHISMRAIPTDHKVVTALHPFIVRWGEGSAKNYLLLAGDDENIGNKWVKSLLLYSQIQKRFDGALLWKLNSDIVTSLPQNFEEAREYLADIRNWRRRLCFLEQLHTQKSLCITYLSEKADDGAVANILAKAGQGTVATIEKMPGIPVAFMTSWDAEHVRSNVLQYYISVFGSRFDQECVLPKELHGFQVFLPESLAASGGHAHSVYAFDDAASLQTWLESMEAAIQELSKDSNVKSS